MFSNESTTRGLALAVTAAAGALALLTGCAGTEGSTSALTGATGAPSEPPAASERPSAPFNGADVEFAQMMIPHHRQAVEMAELAESRASDPRVRKLAARIKAAQDPEIATMTGWLTAWGRPATPEGGHGGHDMSGMMSEEEMAKLEKAKGAAFDRMFLELMIAHHRGAVEMAETELAKGADPQAKQLARAIESAQRAEIEQMRQMLGQS
ncbi:DUF305 domain-containing protein [Streptosporangium carneum]|uniref:Lipoprotein n=1 Tax=Streptosporangium carneum TaxID=47481 RepID=A0A9W6MCN6_9ACTN|nr:DUF305 domain-containing protein [Streptosporangium carneum]GLK08923.1 lipoprotein [Streptosporangium carneum]